MSRRHRDNPLSPPQRQLELQQRVLARERLRVIGLLIVIIAILALTFLRFGKTIPWAAR